MDVLTSIMELKKELEQCWQAQLETVAFWHENVPETTDGNGLRELVLQQHLRNFKLWHVEDRARRKDVDGEIIARCKYEIDALNQQRNDLIEQVDACLIRRIGMFLPGDAVAAYNTETIGSALDRLSILSLKIFHMQEQTVREDADTAHKAGCADKLAILREQHQDLSQSVLALVDEYAAGTKQPKVYFQFKMYNDPSLNPELYTHEES